MAIIGALPVTLTNGTIADATQVMADFNYILAQVNANAAPITGGTYLPLAGGTLTGNLTVNGTVQMVPGALIVGAAAASNCNISLQSAAGFYRQISFYTGANLRWAMYAAGTAESGSNAGSDFGINSYTDAGTGLGTPLSINRASGQVALPNQLNANGSINIAPPSVAAGAYITSTIAANRRWALYLANGTAESGSNNGSDFGLNCYSDANAFIATPISIKRSTGVTTFSAAIVNGPSDRTLKENIAPLEDSLDKVLALQGVGFNFKATPEKREIGLIAQDVAPIVPEIVQDYQSGEGQRLLALDYPKLTALLIESVKTLTARIEALEAKLAT